MHSRHGSYDWRHPAYFDRMQLLRLTFRCGKNQLNVDQSTSVRYIANIEPHNIDRITFNETPYTATVYVP